MTKWGNFEWAVVLAVLPALAWMSGWAPVGASGLASLSGAGIGFGLIWACGLCVGGALIIGAGGGPSILGFLAATSSVAKVTACIGACYGALSL